MIAIGLAFAAAAVLATAAYTFNFGRWAGRKGNRVGAFGLYVLAVLTVVVPVWVWLRARV